LKQNSRRTLPGNHAHAAYQTRDGGGADDGTFNLGGSLLFLNGWDHDIIPDSKRKTAWSAKGTDYDGTGPKVGDVLIGSSENRKGVRREFESTSAACGKRGHPILAGP